MDVSGIISLIKSGGFVNPVSSGVSAALNGLTIPTLSELTALATAQNSANIPTQLQLETALTAVNNSIAKTNELLAHTDKISGVDLTGDGTFATIAKTVQAAKSINGEKSCASVLAAFGAIQKAAELVTDTLNTVQLIESFLGDVANSVDEIPAQMESYANKVTQQIVGDTAALATARIAVLENAVANSLVSLVKDECVAQVLSGIMAAPLKQEVTRVADELAAQKLI